MTINSRLPVRPMGPEIIAIGEDCLKGASDLRHVVVVGAGLTLREGSRNRAVIPGVYEGPLPFGPDMDRLWAALPALPDITGLTAAQARKAVMPWATVVAEMLPANAADAGAVAAAVVATRTA
tara:strand:- start:11326 stop:11694 length:369 start_codon:yes stop_codon:yes gene_type:complete